MARDLESQHALLEEGCSAKSTKLTKSPSLQPLRLARLM